MCALPIEELHNPSFVLIFEGTASCSNDGAGGVPLEFGEDHGGVDSNRVIIFIIAHEYESALLVPDAQPHRGVIGQHVGLLEPVHPRQGQVRVQVVLRLNDTLQP